MFQCLPNSIGGPGRRIVFSTLHCITNRIVSVSVTQCVRKNFVEDSEESLVKLCDSPAAAGLQFAQTFW